MSLLHLITPYRPHEVEERTHAFQGGESHVVRALVTWREERRTSLQGAGSWEGEQIHWRDRTEIQKDLGC